MRNETEHHHEDVVTLDGQEYQCRVLDAMGARADLEIEAWQLLCSERATTTVSTMDRPSRQDGGR